MRRGGLLFWQEVLVSIGQLLAGWFVGMFTVRSRFWLCALLLAFGRLAVQAGAAGALAPPAPTHLVTLGWNPSPDRNTVGTSVVRNDQRGIYEPVGCRQHELRAQSRGCKPASRITSAWWPTTPRASRARRRMRSPTRCRRTRPVGGAKAGHRTRAHGNRGGPAPQFSGQRRE